MLLADATARLGRANEASQCLWLRRAAETLSAVSGFIPPGPNDLRDGVLVMMEILSKRLLLVVLREIIKPLRCFHTTWSVRSWLFGGCLATSPRCSSEYIADKEGEARASSPQHSQVRQDRKTWSTL